MCFSAGASFGAAAVLGAAGIVTINKVKSPSQMMFAAMPLLFGLQQLAEGFEWLSFNHPDFEYLRSPMMYLFLVFAQLLWPSWVPLSIMVMEPNEKRKRALMYLSGIGLICSGILAYRLIYFPVVSDIEGHHIRYDIGSPEWIIYTSTVLYFISTLVSPLISSFKYMKPLGLVMLTALIVTQIFYSEYLISVWCFFCAILSVVIYMVVHSSYVNRAYFESMLRGKQHRKEWQ